MNLSWSVWIDILLAQAATFQQDSLYIYSTKHVQNKLQEQLDKDLQEIRQDNHIFVKADKTTNRYKSEPNDYMNIVQKNVTKA